MGVGQARLRQEGGAGLGRFGRLVPWRLSF